MDDEDNCTCSVCEVGRISNMGLQYARYKERIKRAQEVEGHKENRQDGPHSLLLCNYCPSEIRIGQHHICSKHQRRQNLGGLVRQNSNKSNGLILSNQLKEMSRESSTSYGEEMLVATHGTPLPVTVGRKTGLRVKPAPFFSAEKLQKI